MVSPLRKNPALVDEAEADEVDEVDEADEVEVDCF